MQCTVLQTFAKQKLMQNLTRIHGGLFELEILEIFATAFLPYTIS